MWRYLVRRLIAAMVVVVGVSFVVFLVLHLTPGDPAQVLLGPRATPDDLARLRQELGLDRPVLIQYLRWASHVLRGDFGRSIMQHRAVLPELVRRFSATLILTAGGVLLAFPLGTLVGIVAAARQGTPVDRLMTAAAMLGVSMPAFWVGLLLIITFSVHLGWLPGAGMYSPTGSGGLMDLLVHLVLPAITLALVPLSIIARLTRSSMLDVIGVDYIRTARAKGLSDRTVIGRHAFRNILVAMATVFGLQAGFLLAGAVYVETVFSWPGIGFMMVNAILTRDFPLVQGGVLLVAATYVLINLGTDLLYAYVDPRIRYG